MSIAVNKENIAPLTRRMSNPLAMFEEVQRESDLEIAKCAQAKADAELAAKRKAEEDAGLKLARKMSSELYDRRLAQFIQERQSEDAVRRQLAAEEQAAKDAALARQLAQEELEADRKAREALQQLAISDEAMAKKLQAEEEAAVKDLLKNSEWANAKVQYEQRGSDARFWVVLPGLEHADVNVSHSADGSAVIAIVAVPNNERLERKLLGKLTLDVTLNSISSPLNIQPEDVQVSFNEKSQTLDIVCLNMNLIQDAAKPTGFADRIKSVFSRWFGGSSSSSSSSSK